MFIRRTFIAAKYCYHSFLNVCLMNVLILRVFYKYSAPFHKLHSSGQLGRSGLQRLLRIYTDRERTPDRANWGILSINAS